jgi:hypothetical protein
MDLFQARDRLMEQNGFTSIKSSIKQNGFISSNILIRQKWFFLKTKV